MNNRVFANRIGQIHEAWLSKVLHIPQATSKGIDLLDDDVGIEVKGRMKKYSNNFAVHAYQYPTFRRETTAELFWAFVLYGFPKKVEDVTKKDDLSKMISSRRIWLLEWDYVKDMPIHETETGPYIYVHSREFPKTENFATYTVGRNTLHIPFGSILEEKLKSEKMIEKYRQRTRFNQTVEDVTF